MKKTNNKNKKKFVPFVGIDPELDKCLAKAWANDPRSIAEIAKEHGVSSPTVIRSARRWYGTAKRESVNIELSHLQERVSSVDKDTIDMVRLSFRVRKKSVAEIANTFKISEALVIKILSKRRQRLTKAKSEYDKWSKGTSGMSFDPKWIFTSKSYAKKILKNRDMGKIIREIRRYYDRELRAFQNRLKSINAHLDFCETREGDKKVKIDEFIDRFYDLLE